MSLLRGASFRVFPQRCALVVAGLLLDVANHRREVFLGDGKGAVGPLPLYGFIGSEHMGHQMIAAVAGCAAACKGLSIDGKYTRTPFWDDHYAQQQSGQNGQEPYGMVRTLTCSLVTEAAEPCLDAVPQLVQSKYYSGYRPE